MTRINVGVKPSELSNKHLLAEHREIKRIPNMVKSGRAIMTGIPDKFTLGKGHVKFFYNKQKYLLRRYRAIYWECIKRGFNVTDFRDAWYSLPREVMGDYHPTKEDRELILNRIQEKQK